MINKNHSNLNFCTRGMEGGGTSTSSASRDHMHQRCTAKRSVLVNVGLLPLCFNTQIGLLVPRSFDQKSPSGLTSRRKKVKTNKNRKWQIKTLLELRAHIACLMIYVGLSCSFVFVHICIYLFTVHKIQSITLLLQSQNIFFLKEKKSMSIIIIHNKIEKRIHSNIAR